MPSDNELPDSFTAYRKLEKELDKETGAEGSHPHFPIVIKDGNSGRRVRFPLPGLIGQWFYLRLLQIDTISGLQSDMRFKLELKLLRSSLFRGLPKKQLAVAQWLCARALLDKWHMQAWLPFGLTPDEFRGLHGIRRQCERIERELTTMIDRVKCMMSHTFSDEVDMHQELERAAVILRKFRQRAGDVVSRTQAKEFKLNHFRPFWMFRLPAIAYALFRLLTEHSDPRILRREAYRRIGTFEQEYLGRKSRSAESDPEDTVRRQVYTFKRRANRKQMDGILKRLLAGKWYCLDHPLNCDWENPKTLPHPHSEKFHAKP